MRKLATVTITCSICGKTVQITNCKKDYLYKAHHKGRVYYQ